MDTDNDNNLLTSGNRHRKRRWPVKEIIIAIITLAFGGYIIPNVFHTLENLQKELEIKVELIEQMTESASMIKTMRQYRQSSDMYGNILEMYEKL